MPKFANTDERYWAEYDGLQNAKHQLLSKYLDGWFPILGSWSGRVLYVDCHAGRGRHRTGHEGSPILAIRRLLQHRHRPRILASTEVLFVLFEIDRENYEALHAEVQALGPLPDGISVYIEREDYEPALRQIFRDLRERNQQLAPTFAFLDPYGFTLSMDLLNTLLSFPKSELLINFMYRYVDMAMHSPSQADNLDSLFGCREWRGLVSIKNYGERANQTIALFSRQLQAGFVTHMQMRASNGALKYVLLHATNHRRGRELIKEAMWPVTPDGSFTAFERHDPNQLVLIEPDPDLRPLKDRLWRHFWGRQVRMNDIYDWLLGELYLKKHVHQILRHYRKRAFVEFTDYSGRFGFGKNPLVSFPSERPKGS